MIVTKPDTAFEATVAAGVFATGLTGTVGVRIIDNAGDTTVARATAGIIEYPAGSTIYQATLDAIDTPGQYSIVWDDGTDFANEDLLVFDALFVPIGAGDDTAYATVAELAALLKVDADINEEALSRVLIAAAREIDAEVGNTEPYDDPPALAVEVNLERAVEHWQQMQSPFGIIGLGGLEGGSARTARDTWERHAFKLAPLKEVWGLA